ncbi:c-type cytochrome [Pelomicrobium sp. G1]|uniref:c-type cytochrome n=1 Tax=Pelomicrobium sp. G1 TaxID=3452920 RepID=UPI003F76D2C8
MFIKVQAVPPHSAGGGNPAFFSWCRRLLAAVFAWAAVSAAGEAPSPARQGELLALLRHDCGSCHGLTLRGGLGPPLLPSALSGKDPQGLAAAILHGRPGTAMPPWSRFLSEDEAAWLAHRLLEGVPDER